MLSNWKIYIVSTHFASLSLVILHFPHLCNFPLIPSLVSSFSPTYNLFFFPLSVLPLQISIFFVSVELELCLYWIISPLLQ